MLAYDFPLLSVFWGLTFFWVGFVIVFAIIWVFIDNFRRTDHGGWAKAIWAMVILLLPLFGMFAYMVSKPSHTNTL
ncbi:MAG TPA: PLDc N-terminal domain-containing protein [Acidimicrobiales bacterium]|nr:PLDc N-terminal domain-containing protein [Acidimicrobiales bacterium]